MKRILFTVALCLVASASFGQKKAVKDAQSVVKGANPNFEEARTLIQGALENAETKDNAETWYVAGYVEDQQFSAERTKQILGQQPDEEAMYTSLFSELPYFLKSYELDQLPDAKGKVKPKFTKKIKDILSANHVYYINGGAYYFDQRDYQKAYDFFQQYMQICDLPMFQGEAIAQRDSNYMTVQFYAAVAATQMNNSELAIAALERAKTSDFRGNDVYQYLCYEYEQAKDSVNLEKTLKEGMQKFPEEKYYLLSLINVYIYSDRNEEALEYLNAAVANEPDNAQLYDVIGRVYESGLKDTDNAEKYFLIALEKDPDNADVLSNVGRIYYNRAVQKQNDASAISDQEEYQKELAKAKEDYQKALPYFEKAHELNPDARDVMVALRGIYYNLNMGEKFEAIEAKMNS